MSFKQTFVALAAVAVAGGASAAAPTVWDYTSNSGTLLVSASLDSGVTTRQIRTAELFGTNTDPAGSFAAFCLEPTVLVGDFPGVSIPVAVEISASVADEFSRIFTGAGWESWASGSDAVTTAAQRAAIQLAVWDIALDGVFNLSDGIFQSADPLAASAVAFYAAGDTSLADYVYKLTDSIERTGGKQDVIIVTSPIPEPSTYALMIAGIAAVGFVARRRSNRA
jgi:hypothetical protein